jgi:hypothetical protein
MPQVYGDKVKGLKELFQFRTLLKSKVVAYKKAIGTEPDPSLLKQILWVCMDVSSKQLVSQSGLHHKSYDEICEDIDIRLCLQYDGLDVAKAAKGDDPMGLSNVFELSTEAVSSPPY